MTLDPLEMSACFIVRDEEGSIERALKSIRPYVKELVVLDTGSVDETVKIAKRYADKLGCFEWSGDFAAARNACAALAGYDWIFSMDADEEIVSFDMGGVLRGMKDAGALGRYSVRNLIEGRAESDSSVHVTRIYNRSFYRYEGRVHEMLMPIGGDASGRKLFNAPVVADHFGYLSEAHKLKDKTRRNREILVSELEKNPHDAYYHFQLGKNYNYAGELENACASFKKSLELQADVRLEYVADLIECYGNALLTLKRYDEAAGLLVYAGKLKSPRNQFAFGMIYMNTGQFDKAIQCFQSCIVPGSAAAIESYMPRYNIGVILECTGNISDALAQYAMCGDFLPAHQRIKALKK